MRDAHKGQVAGRTGSGSNYTIVVHTRRIGVGPCADTAEVAGSAGEPTPLPRARSPGPPMCPPGTCSAYRAVTWK